VSDALGPIDVWVNNAMTTVFGYFADVAPAEFKRATEVTYLGQVHGTMAALSLMEPRDRGTIVNVGSALAFVGIPLQAAYCGAKFACRGFFESVRAELLHKKSNVRIAMVHLPAVNTPQFNWCENKLDHLPQPVPPSISPSASEANRAGALEGRSTSWGAGTGSSSPSTPPFPPWWRTSPPGPASTPSRPTTRTAEAVRPVRAAGP